jgi:peptide/nickel transport system substrate-binding protein
MPVACTTAPVKKGGTFQVAAPGGVYATPSTPCLKQAPDGQPTATVCLRVAHSKTGEIRYDNPAEVSETKTRFYLSLVTLAIGAGLLGAAAAQGGDSGASIRNGGTFRIASVGIGNIDPALLEEFDLIDATCARLLTYPDKPPPEGFRLVPEVAAGYPLTSKDGKTYTFTLRRGFRFSNGAPVRASAFARAITRNLELKGGGAELVKDIVGAKQVQEGRAQTVAGIDATGNRFVVRLIRPDPDFPAKMTAPSFCAVPPTLPADPEGVTTFPAAGPYYVAENVRGRRMVLRRNRFYRGSRPHRVDSFVVDGRAGSFDDVLDRIERGQADWGWAPAAFHLNPNRRLIAKYGINRSQFFLEPGLTFRHYHLNTSRPLFRNNPRLRRAVNFAVNRYAIRREVGGSVGSILTDQYLPPGLPGFRDARIYPLRRPNLRKARALARNHTRGGKAVLYTYDFHPFIAAAQVIKQNLKEIGLDVEVKGIPPPAYYDRIINNPAEPWDLASSDWVPDYLDPYTYLNSLLDGQFIPGNNLSHFNSPKYNRLLRQTARLQGAARYRAYGALDVQLARDAAPIVAISYLKEPTLVSKRVDRRCIVLRPRLDLTAVCLKR